MTEQSSITPGSGNLGITPHAPVTSTRINFALQHLLGAARLSRQAYQIERINAGQVYGPFFEELLHIVPASIMLSVASLEAFVNELFADGTERFPSVRKELLDTIWDLAERVALLEKFDLTLTLKGVPAMEKGQASYQNVDTLVHLRNALVHFKPEWDDELDKHARLSKRLKHKFSLSPFILESEPLFPKRFISHGCAEWAVRSVVEFLRDFQEKLKMEQKIDASNIGLRTTE